MVTRQHESQVLWRGSTRPGIGGDELSDSGVPSLVVSQRGD